VLRSDPPVREQARASAREPAFEGA
jgi:hypothetical protein